MIGSPPRGGPRLDGARAPIHPAIGSGPPPARDRPTGPEWRWQLAALGLAVLVLLHVLTALGFLFVLTTVPAHIDLQTGPRPSAVGRPADPSAPGHPTGPAASGPEVAAPDAIAPGLPAPAVRATVLDIPKLGIRHELLELGVDGAGVLQPPAIPDRAGWFTEAAAPGEHGPTVIAGHVDSRAGPGVFHALTDLARGDLVTVGRSDGATATYRVTDVLTVDKDRFPTRRVYGPTAGAELHLITCGGDFDRRSGHYLRNVVVSGLLVDPS